MDETERIELYKSLKNYLSEHQPIAAMSCTRSPIPMQQLHFTHDYHTFGIVSAKNIIGWRVNDDFDVEVKTTEKRFTVELIPLKNTTVTDYQEFVNILLGNKVNVEDFEFGPISDFDMEMCNQERVLCKYTVYREVEEHEITPDNFKEAKFYRNVVKVTTSNIDEIGLNETVSIPVEWL